MSHQFFVYGTLKRGYRNETVWPCRPLSIQSAWVRGALFAGPNYPAMKTGSDRVLGEVWMFDESACPEVLWALDALEGTNGNSPQDLYHRFVTETFDVDGNALGEAYVYRFVSDPPLQGFVRIPVGSDDYVVWPADS